MLVRSAGDDPFPVVTSERQGGITDPAKVVAGFHIGDAQPGARIGPSAKSAALARGDLSAQRSAE
jgi:hypothetical protein